MKLTIIGCGRLGKTLGYLWKKNNLVCIQDIYNASIVSASSAVTFIGEGTACHTMSQFKPADIYLIATPDDQIETLCQQLAEQASPKAGSLVFHCSGLHTSECLNAVKLLGCYTASLHPLFGFSNPAADVHTFAGSYCSFEGNSKALDRISQLIKGIGGQLFMVEKQHKALYHAASVFASNYLVTLSVIAKDCYEKSGLSNSLSKTLVHNLMEQSLSRIKSSSDARNALTGPIQRSDKATLKKHLKTLESFTDLAQVYKSLGKTTVKLTEHHAELKKELEALF
ncbi:MAG: Rossmann-like and DUF2520 domain-containing protein [Pseudomonadota bacterium]